MKYFMTALRFKIFMIVLLGLVYPFMMTGISQVIFPAQANGDFLSRDGVIVGAKLIGQNFEKPEYFWPRPSTVGYNPQPSGGSNLGLASEVLKKIVEERRAKLKAAHPYTTEEPPQDLLFASGSGLDPHISAEAAQYQLQRVAQTRNVDKAVVQKLLDEVTESRQLGILGEKTVNVLVLNMALDKKR